MRDTPEVIAKYGDAFEPHRENWEPLHGDIEFRDVSFKYPDGDEYVLEHFNLKVPQGTNVAIVEKRAPANRRWLTWCAAFSSRPAGKF